MSILGGSEREKTRNTQGELVFLLKAILLRGRVCSRCEHVLVFPWDQRGLLLGIPNLLMGSIYHVKK